MCHMNKRLYPSIYIYDVGNNDKGHCGSILIRSEVRSGRKAMNYGGWTADPECIKRKAASVMHNTDALIPMHGLV